MYGSLILLRYSGFPARERSGFFSCRLRRRESSRRVISRIMASAVVLSRIENSTSFAEDESTVYLRCTIYWLNPEAYGASYGRILRKLIMLALRRKTIDANIKEQLISTSFHGESRIQSWIESCDKQQNDESLFVTRNILQYPLVREYLPRKKTPRATTEYTTNKLSRRPRLRCHRELISPRKNACVRQDAHLVAAQTPPPPPRSRRCVMNGFFCKRQSAVARRHTAGCCYSGPVASLSVHIPTI